MDAILAEGGVAILETVTESELTTLSAVRLYYSSLVKAIRNKHIDGAPPLDSYAIRLLRSSSIDITIRQFYLVCAQDELAP